MKFFFKYFILLCFLFFASPAKTQNGDIGLLRKLYTPEILPSDEFFRVTSHSVSPISVTVPLFYFGASLLQKDKNIKRNISFQRGVKSAFSIGGAGLLSYGLKYSVQRIRPYNRYPDIIPKMHASTYSFPSGHTTFAFATATIVSLNHKKWYITVPMYAWAFTVAYSRLHLGVHYPTDLLGGMVIGCGTSLLFHHLSKNWFRQKKEPRSTL